MAGATFVDPSQLSEQSSDLQLTKATKKRKWGEPIGEIKQIIPPRKRAKTAEEKHQRAQERIQRNRDAAEASRKRKNEQRQAVGDQRDQLQALAEQLIARLRELGDTSCIPDKDTLEYLMSKPERDLMSANERKRAEDFGEDSIEPTWEETKKTKPLSKISVQAPQASLPSPVSSPTSQVSRNFTLSPDMGTQQDFTPGTSYASDFGEETTESARLDAQHGGLFSTKQQP